MHDRKYTEDEHVLCPFYKRECDNEIKCEGLISETMTNRFHTVVEKKRHKEQYCTGKCETCKLYCVLEQKYEGDSA